MNIHCPYCKSVIEQVNGDIYRCYNHNSYISVDFLIKGNFISVIYMENEEYHILIKRYRGKKKHLMDFYKLTVEKYSVSYNILSANLPLDINLTPENFETKVKTYLTFQ